jgi:hypothetical protein
MRVASHFLRYGAAAAFATAVVAPSAAHHSYADFDRCVSASIEGDIQHVSWGNPHVWLRLETEGGRFNVIWFDLRQMRRLGIEARDFRTGDRLIITGSAHRDPNERVMALVTELRRPRDGWVWTREAGGAACDE